MSLSFDTTGTSISGSYNAGTGVLTLSGVDTIDHYQTVLRTIKYNNSGDPGVDSITVSVVASDGVVSSRPAIVRDHGQPALDRRPGRYRGLGQYHDLEQHGPVNVADASAATVTDTVDGSPDSITLTITNPHAGDILAAVDSGGVTSSWDAANNRMILTGGIAAAYQTVLRTVTYNNTIGGPGVSVNVGTVNINVVGVSGPVTSRTAVAHIIVPPVIDLNGTSGVQKPATISTRPGTNAGPHQHHGHRYDFDFAGAAEPA